MLSLRLTFVVINISCLHVSLTCSPPKERASLADRIRRFQTSYVIYGKTTEIHSIEGIDGYTATLEVYCGFTPKGYQPPSFLNISNLGTIPGMCQSTNVNLGEDYIMILKHIGERWLPKDSETKATTLSLLELASVCELTATSPAEMNDLHEKCAELNLGCKPGRLEIKLHTTTEVETTENVELPEAGRVISSSLTLHATYKLLTLCLIVDVALIFGRKCFNFY